MTEDQLEQEGSDFYLAAVQRNSLSAHMVDVNYPDPSAATILAGGSGE